MLAAAVSPGATALPILTAAGPVAGVPSASVECVAATPVELVTAVVAEGAATALAAEGLAGVFTSRVTAGEAELEGVAMVGFMGVVALIPDAVCAKTLTGAMARPVARRLLDASVRRRFIVGSFPPEKGLSRLRKIGPQNCDTASLSVRPDCGERFEIRLNIRNPLARLTPRGSRVADPAGLIRREVLTMPLTGVRILDLTRVLSGPFCTALLGDLGADVVKVEAPEGDSVRGQGAIRDGLSWYFAQFNRNKRSIRLDLRKPEGREVLGRLIAQSDVLVENFRPGVLARMGFGPERLRVLRPSLVTCAINGFGSTGPYRDRPAFDFIAQAMSGFMSVNGRPDDPPLRSGLPISDLIAGLYAALAITASVMRARATGQGQQAEVSLTNGLISLLAYIATNTFATGAAPPRSGNDHPIAAPYGLFPTRDGQIALAPPDDAFFGRLMDALEEPALKTDPLYATQAARVANRARINAIVGGKLAARETAYWVETLNAAGVPCGPVNTVEEVFADPQVLAQDMVMDVEHPGHGLVRMLGFPMKLSETPCRVTRPAPRLGEHSDEVLAAAGYGEAERAALRSAGVI